MPVLDSLVVVDSDPRSRDAIAFGFEREGCAVQATSDGREALALAGTRVPQVAVAGATLGGMTPLELVSALRAEPRTRALPLLLVGDAADRNAALIAGADDYVVRPAFIKDVVTLARLLAARGGEANDRVTGRLSEWNLYFLARALHAATRSATVALQRGERSGELRFLHGELIFARVGKLSGANAFHQLLLWDAARVEVMFGDFDAGPKRMQKPVDRLLEDAARYVAQFDAVAAKVGGPKVVYRRDERQLAAERRQVPAEVASIVPLYDGARSLTDVVEDSPFKPFDTIMITHRLAELEVIRRTVDPPRTQLSARLAVRDVLLADGTDEERGGELSRLVADVLAKGDAAARSSPPRARKGAAEPPRPASGARTAPGDPPPSIPVEAPVVAAATTPTVAAEPPRERAKPSPVAVKAPVEATQGGERPPPSVVAKPPPVAAEATRPPLEPLVKPPSPVLPVAEEVSPPVVDTAPAARPLDPKPAASRPGAGATPPSSPVAAPRAKRRETRRSSPPPLRNDEPAPVAAAPTRELPVERTAAHLAPSREAPIDPARLGDAFGAATFLFPKVDLDDASRAQPPRATPALSSGPSPAPAAAGPDRTGRRPKASFEALEEEFFERAADLQRVDPVDNFDDLDE